MVIGSARPTVTLQKLQKWANRAPLPTDEKILPDGDTDHKFWREVVIAYRFPLVMVVLALVPDSISSLTRGMEESAGQYYPFVFRG
jgi:hypothetical protein